MTFDKGRAARALLIIAIVQFAVFAVLFAGNFPAAPRYLGFKDLGAVSPTAWGAATAVAILYVAWAATLLPVRYYLFRLDLLKALAVFAALLAGVVEEVVFRRLVMDWLFERGYGIAPQIIASAVGFGAVHLFWGVRRLAAGINAFLSTTILGAALACVYLLSDRSLAPVVIAHCIISGLIEPGLVIAAAEDRLGAWRERESEGA